MKFGDCQVCMAFLAGVRISQTELLKKFGEMVGGGLLANAKLLIHFSVLKYQKNLVSHKYLEPPLPPTRTLPWNSQMFACCSEGLYTKQRKNWQTWEIKGFFFYFF